MTSFGAAHTGIVGKEAPAERLPDSRERLAESLVRSKLVLIKTLILLSIYPAPKAQKHNEHVEVQRQFG